MPVTVREDQGNDQLHQVKKSSPCQSKALGRRIMRKIPQPLSPPALNFLPGLSTGGIRSKRARDLDNTAHDGLPSGHRTEKGSGGTNGTSETARAKVALRSF